MGLSDHASFHFTEKEMSPTGICSQIYCVGEGEGREREDIYLSVCVYEQGRGEMEEGRKERGGERKREKKGSKKEGGDERKKSIVKDLCVRASACVCTCVCVRVCTCVCACLHREIRG